jgi:hypothetical protein
VTKRFTQGSSNAAFRVSLSEQASLTVFVERATRGRRTDGRCKANVAKRARCTAWLLKTKLDRIRARRGANRLPLRATVTGRLPAGTYRVRVRATDSTGNRSRVVISNQFVIDARKSTSTLPTSPVRPLPVSPGTSGADPVVAAAGDIACDPTDTSFNGGAGDATACRQRYTADLIDDGAIAQVLALGDLQYADGTLTAFQASYDLSWGLVKPITRPAVGNHEYHTMGAAGYFDYFNGVGFLDGAAGERGKGYYSFDVGAWHLIALNSNCTEIGGCAVGSPQDTWLREDLRANPAACTLAYFHHPRFSSGSKGNDLTVEPLWQALYDHGADVVLSGHDHLYERFAPQTPTGLADPAFGMRQFTVGTGGKSSDTFTTVQVTSEVRSALTYGVLKLTLHPTGYDWQFVSEAGTAFQDLGGDTCHAARAR